MPNWFLPLSALIAIFAVLIAGAAIAEHQFNSIIATATEDVSVMEYNKPENILGKYRAGTRFNVAECEIKSSAKVSVQLPDKSGAVGVLDGRFVMRRTGPIPRIWPHFVGGDCQALINAWPDKDSVN